MLSIFAIWHVALDVVVKAKIFLKEVSLDREHEPRMEGTIER